MDHRKNNKPEDGEKLVIDYMLSALHDSPARMLADMSTVIVEGFHTSGLCKLPDIVNQYSLLYI